MSPKTFFNVNVYTFASHFILAPIHMYVIDLLFRLKEIKIERFIQIKRRNKEKKREKLCRNEKKHTRYRVKKLRREKKDG